MGALALVAYYGLLSYARLEVFKMLLTSFFPLMVLILAVLGSIVFRPGPPTRLRWVPSVACCWRQPAPATDLQRGQGVGIPDRQDQRHGLVAVRRLGHLLGSVRALLGGQELVEQWVLGMNLSRNRVLVCAVIIFSSADAGVDRDHRDLHAHLHPAAGQLRD